MQFINQTYLAGVDRNAVILVLDNRVLDGNARGLANIETVGVVAAIIVTVRIINSNPINNEIIGLDAESLHGGVLDREARDGRVVQRVGIEELGLGLATIGAFSIPPPRAVSVDYSAIGSLDGDIGSRDLDERTAPLFVTERSGAFEDDLFAPLEMDSHHRI
jgi:hypothetical protein